MSGSVMHPVQHRAGPQRRVCLVLHDSVVIGPHFYRHDALKGRAGQQVSVDYWDNDPSTIIVSELDGRLIARIVTISPCAVPAAESPFMPAIEELEGEVRAALDSAKRASLAWAFNAEQLDRALTAHFKESHASGALDLAECALFKGLLIGFLRSDEAAKLRIATPAEVKV